MNIRDPLPTRGDQGSAAALFAKSFLKGCDLIGTVEAFLWIPTMPDHKVAHFNRDFRALDIVAIDPVEGDHGWPVRPVDQAVLEPDLGPDITVVADDTAHIILIFLDDFDHFRHNNPHYPDWRRAAWTLNKIQSSSLSPCWIFQRRASIPLLGPKSRLVHV